jgi:hypothetical protein
MELKQHLSLEAIKNDFAFMFHMPTGASWGNAIDAAFEVLQKLHELQQQSIQNMKPADPQVVAPEVMNEEAPQGE